MKEINAKFRYRGYDIYTQNGEFTVGGDDNCSFDDCTLENFGYVDEYKAVRWLREKGYGIKFNNLRGGYDCDKYEGCDVPYHRYLEYLLAFNHTDGNHTDEELIVPVICLNSIKEAKEFIDWVIDESKNYKLPEWYDCVEDGDDELGA